MSLADARWTLRSLRRTRRQLREGGLESVRIAPAGSADPERGVARLVLSSPRWTCLERALVRQAARAARGPAPEVIIGVRAPSDDFMAHAWLEGDDDPEAAGLTELTRHRWPAAR
jgi:transglutaminase superfamily protein